MAWERLSACGNYARDLLGDTPYTFYLNKSVKCYNFRLSVLGKSIQMLVVAFILTNFCVGEGYLKRAAPKGNVIWWASGYEKFEDLFEAEDRDLQKSYCTRPEEFDYMYDFSNMPSSDYRKNSCLQFCRSSRNLSTGFCGVHEDCSRLHGVKLGCRDPVELFQNKGGNIFVPTHLQIVSGRLGTSSVDANYLLTGLDTVNLFFRVSFSARNPALMSMDNDINGSTSSMVTIIRFPNGTEKVFQPGDVKHVSLTLQDVLVMAGVNLDRLAHKPGANVLLNAHHPEGVLTRITGAPIKLKFHISDEEGYRLKTPSCVITAELEDEFQWNPETALVRGLNIPNTVLWRYHGIRIENEIEGSFGFTDYYQILLSIAASLTFLSIPYTVVTFVATFLLGRVSHVYARKTAEPLDLQDELAVASMQLLHTSAAFNSLADPETGKITDKRFEQELDRVFASHPNWQASTRKRIIHFAHRNVVKMKRVLNSQKSFQDGLAWFERDSAEVRGQGMDVEDFCAGSMGVTVSSRALASFFQDSLSWRERIFMENRARLLTSWNAEESPQFSPPSIHSDEFRTNTLSTPRALDSRDVEIETSPLGVDTPNTPKQTGAQTSCFNMCL